MHYELFAVPHLIDSLLSQFRTAPFTCEHEGKRYRSFEKFNSGPGGCARCLCLNGKVDCDETQCKPQILIDPPAPSTERIQQNNVVTERVALPDSTRPPAVQPPILPRSQGNEKGPSTPDLAYYASQLTDVSQNQEKGPASAGMQYMPEQYSYLQAQAGAPGLRGPPGLPGVAGPQGFQGELDLIYFMSKCRIKFVISVDAQKN